jgi:low molecular weight protein-tyrosine phosphatase
VTFHILFVCTGNVCRSPAAERLLRRHLDGVGGGIAGLSGVDVSSAGTGALVGDPVSPPMAALMEQAGADAGGFAARQLTPLLVRSADLIITMTSAHRRETVTMVPAAVQRTFVLGELAHMLDGVGDAEVAAAGGASASTAERLRVAMAIAKRHRTPGVDPAEDIVDPYGRSDSVYSSSFAQIQAALEPLVRIVTGDLAR